MARAIKRNDADMTQGVIWKQLIAFSIPMMLGMLFQQLYNTVDTLVVGQFVGKEALAAVGSTGSIINTLVGIFNGLSLGATVVISQCYGAHDDAGLHKAVQTTFMMTFILCVIITILGMFLVGPLVRMMDTPDDVIGESMTYLRIYFAGISGLMVYNMGSGVLRAVGDSKRPLYFLIFSALTNVVLDLVFVIVFHMGVAGVAYATIVSQFLSSILVLYVLTKTDANYKIDWRNLKLDMPMLKKIFGIGFPTSIQQGVTSFSNVFVQSYINAFGSACMAAWSIYNKLDIYALIPMQCIAAASSTFVGQNYGAQDLPRAKKGVTTALQLSMGISVILLALMMIFRSFFVSFFSSDPEVIGFAEYFVLMISPFYLLTSFNQIYSGALRGSGDTKIPVIIMMFSFIAFRQAYLFIAKALGNNFTMITLAYPAGWLMCSSLMAIYYHRSKFFKAAVKSEKEIKNTAQA